MTNICEVKFEAQIKNAIAKSAANNQIVSINFDGDIENALSVFLTLTDWTDYAVTDGRMDIWGFEKGSEDGEMLWRLAINFTLI